MASSAIDGHEFSKQMFLEWLNPRNIPVDMMDEALRGMKSVIVTDSKNMYDSINRIESCGLQLEEKRLAIEILSFRKRIHAAGISCKWVDSDQQLADNLSKAFVYETMLKVFQSFGVSLLFDPSFTSAKKKRAQKQSPAWLFYFKDQEDSCSSKENF